MDSLARNSEMRSSGGPRNGAPDAGRFQSHEQLLELLVFLFLIGPSMVLSFFVIRQGQVSFMFAAVATILRDLSLVSLVIFFLWRNGEPYGRIGWDLTSSAREVFYGMVLFVPLFFGAGLLDQFFLAMGLSQPSTPTPKFLTARNPKEFVVAFFLVLVVAIAEETVFRGYLILRITAVTRSTLMAVVLSSVIFSLGHGYEGTAGVATVGFMGLAFAAVYIWRQSLVAPIVMHFLQDLFTILILPLLKLRGTS